MYVLNLIGASNFVLSSGLMISMSIVSLKYESINPSIFLTLRVSVLLVIISSSQVFWTLWYSKISRTVSEITNWKTEQASFDHALFLDAKPESVKYSIEDDKSDRSIDFINSEMAS